MKPLFTLFVLTAAAVTVAQLPALKELRPLGLLLDSIPVGGVVIVTLIAALRLRRVSTLPIGLLATSSYFAGALVYTFGSAHVVAVVITAIQQQRRDQFVYSFRFYSLVLLGVLLVAGGLVAAIQATSLARGQRAAWRAALAVWAAILAMNLPLVPLQGFAVLFSALAALELILLGSMRRHFDVESARAARLQRT